MSTVSEDLKAMTNEFEHEHGFPPGTNVVRPATTIRPLLACSSK
ncbi:hypothetical protein ACFVQ0_26125 [Streptomyces sp. NPDC057900]